MAAKKPTVAIMGSKTDWTTLEHTVKTLKEFGVESTVKVMSAHRTPHEATEFAENAAKNGYKVIIGAAGGAAHLCGVLAGHTTLPVIDSVTGWALDGLDSLYLLYNAKGVPVATVAIGKAGAINAGILAVQIMGTADATLRRKMKSYKKKMAADVLASDAELQSELNS